MLSTVTPSVFLDITVLYEDSDFRGVDSWRSDLPQLSEAEREEKASLHRRRFGILREVYKARKFRLTLCANVWGGGGEYPVRMLEEAAAEEEAKGGFCDFIDEPLVVYSPQRTR